jgi:hypothetical protein
LIDGGFTAPLGVIEVDQVVFDKSLQLRCISCQDIDNLDIGFLLIATPSDEADHFLIGYVYYSRGIGILVLEDDLSGCIGEDCSIIEHQHGLQDFEDSSSLFVKSNLI